MVSRTENSFQKGDIVWAKVKGYSWWPGQIQYQIHNNKGNSESITKEKIYRINFIGDKSFGDVPIYNIKKFEEKLDEFSKTKKSSLIKSIEVAKNLFDTKNSILVENKNKNISIKDDDNETISNESYIKNSVYDKIKDKDEKKKLFFWKKKKK